MSSGVLAKRAGATAALVPVLTLVLGTAGCTSATAAGLGACRAAEAVSTASADDLEARNAALIALAERLPDELRSNALLLSQPAPVDTDATTVAQDRDERLAALAALQAWALDTCDIYLTIGAPGGAGLTPTNVVLADFESVVGRDEQGVYVSVLGVPRDDLAVELCEQAMREHADAGGEAPAAAAGAFPSEGFAVHVQVLDPIGRSLAYTDATECVPAG